MILSIMDTINKWGETFKNWIYQNYNNPVFWGVIFLGGIAIFSIAYHALHSKDQTF